jgi:hypothetical protein
MRNNRAYTIAEFMTASALLALLFASVMGAFMFTKGVSYFSIAEYNLQRDTNMIVKRIVRGMREGPTIYGLRSATSFTIPTVDGDEIQFVGTDGNTRRYYISGDSILFESPTQSSVIYTAPENSDLELFFWEPITPPDHQIVGIYVSVAQDIGTRNIIGSVQTVINIRNMPK